MSTAVKNRRASKQGRDTHHKRKEESEEEEIQAEQ
jgi:hypothetical protein